MIILKVNYAQDLLYAKLIMQHYEQLAFTIVKDLDADIPCLNVSNIIPETLGFHPLMTTMYQTKYRKYILNSDSLARPSEANIVNCNNCLRYYKMLKEDFCPLLIAKLLANKNVIIAEHTDCISAQQYEFYKDVLVFVPSDEIAQICTQWDSKTSDELREAGELFYSNYCGTIFVAPELPEQLEVLMHITETLPEDRYEQYELATTYIKGKDSEKHEALKLSPTDGQLSLPEINIITMLQDRPLTYVEEQLFGWNFLTTRYPIDKITWIVGYQQSTKPQWPITYRQCKLVQCTDMRDLVRQCTTDIIHIWAPEVYYLPHSLYAKTKLLIDYPEKSLVGCTTMGHYDYCDSIGWSTTSPDPIEGTICFRKEYYLSRQQEAHLDFHNYKKNVLLFPYTYNCVDIRRNQDVPKEEQATINKLFDFDTQRLMNKLYRQQQRQCQAAE